MYMGFFYPTCGFCTPSKKITKRESRLWLIHFFNPNEKRMNGTGIHIKMNPVMLQS